MASSTPPLACVNCGNKKYQQLFQTADFDGITSEFTITACTNCGLVKTAPELSGEKLSRFYDDEYYGAGDSKFSGPVEKIISYTNRLRAKQILRHTQHRWTDGNHEKQLRILDIGCGRALLLKEFLKFGCDCYGLERADYNYFNSSNQIKYFSQPLESIPVQSDYFDVIILWHVLEHLPDPIKTIKEAVIKLKPGGILVISVPNFDSFQARIFKQHWFHLDVPRHTYHFPSNTLKNILTNEQLRLLYKTTFSFEQNFYGFTQSLLNKFIFFSPPNKLYSLLKKNDGLSNKLLLLGWIVIGSLTVPFALADYFLSGILGKGATVTYITMKVNISGKMI